jgi:hypothetical protein
VSKFNNRKVHYAGFVFDSVAEFHHYQGLQLREYAGEITGLEVHPVFELQAGFTKRGKRYQAISYEADFAYYAGGKRVIEDTKGVLTDTFRIKQKLFEYRYPDLELTIIKVGK